MRINDPQWYPCYLNPTFDEIVELAKSGWDTCRILVVSSYDVERGLPNDFIIASGFGNTHGSVQTRYYIHLGAKRIEVNGRTRWRSKANLPHLDPSILHHSNGIAYMNCEDIGGGQYDRIDKWPLDDTHLEILKDLIRESELAL